MVDTAVLARRLRQVHSALGDLSDADLGSVETRVSEIDGAQLWTTDFSGHFDDAKLHNAAEQLIANIASIKDHLKKWCAANGSAFDAESVLNNKDAAAAVHDLWNSQKHGGLTKPPRSGKVRGDLTSTCRDAIAIWETALITAGMQPPPAPPLPPTSGIVISEVRVSGLPAGSGWMPFASVWKKKT
jgi:plasmid stabilization system protein ParE